MEIALRPLTLGEILDRTASIYRKNFLLLAGISSVYAGSAMVLGFIQISIKSALHTNQFTSKLVDATIGVLEIPIILIMAGICIAAINRTVAWIHLNQPATIRSAYASVKTRLGRYIWLMFLVGLRVYWPMLILGILIAGMFLIPGIRSGSSDGSGMLLLSILLGVLAFIVGLGGAVYMVWQSLRLSLSVPACVVEDLKATGAMHRSAELSEGSLGRIFVLGLLVAVIQMGLSFIGSIPFIIIVFKNAAAHNTQISFGVLAMQQVISFLITTFVTPIYSTGFMLFYYDQRIRKEGFDIEWMMQAAGLSTPVIAANEVATTETEEGSSTQSSELHGEAQE